MVGAYHHMTSIIHYYLLLLIDIVRNTQLVLTWVLGQVHWLVSSLNSVLKFYFWKILWYSHWIIHHVKKMIKPLDSPPWHITVNYELFEGKKKEFTLFLFLLPSKMCPTPMSFYWLCFVTFMSAPKADQRPTPHKTYRCALAHTQLPKFLIPSCIWFHYLFWP